MHQAQPFVHCAAPVLLPYSGGPPAGGAPLGEPPIPCLPPTAAGAAVPPQQFDQWVPMGGGSGNGGGASVGEQGGPKLKLGQLLSGRFEGDCRTLPIVGQVIPPAVHHLAVFSPYT